MASITFAANDELKSDMSKFLWINWSELVRDKLLKRKILAESLLNKLESKEEQELIKWSVELGRKAKKDSFKKLISELSIKEREELLSVISSKNKEEYS